MDSVQSLQLSFGGCREALVSFVSCEPTERVPRKVEHDLFAISEEHWCLDWGPFAVVLITIQEQ